MDFGNYQTTHLLGKGGFATVYLGRHTRLHRPVAIKLLKAHLSEREQQSFLAEARILAQLHHPNIVQVLDFGITQGTPYLVMNYLAHGTLRQEYQTGQAHPLLHCLAHLKQIAEALQYAHDRKIVHRDVKPENMLLGEQREAILTDFGIAVLNQESLQQKKQDIIGTAPYMAPEQIHGLPRRASDQYALAVVAYEWLCGERPFHGERFEQIVFQQVYTPPPSLRTKQPELSPQIDAIVLKALSKDPEGRYPTILEFVSALEQASQGSQYSVLPDAPTLKRSHDNAPSSPGTPAIPPTAPAATRRSVTTKVANDHLTHRRLFLRAGGLAAFLAVGGGAIWWRHLLTQSSSSASQTPHILVATTIYQLTTGAADSVAWSPDSKRLVSGKGDKSQTVQLWNGTKATTLPYSGPVSWSPDGHFIAACNRNFLHIWDTTTNREKASLALLSSLPPNLPDFGPVPKVVIPRAFSWSPDSAYLISGLELPNNHAQAGPDVGLLYLWPQGSFVAHSSTAEPPAGVLALACAADNTRIVYGAADGNVYLYNHATGQTQQYPSHFDQISGLAWSPDGKSILVAGNGWPMQLVDSTHFQDKKSTFLENYGAPLDWSPDGSLVASAHTQQDDYRVWIWQAATGKPVFLCQGHTGKLSALAWSPNGHLLASTSTDSTIRLWSIPQ